MSVHLGYTSDKRIRCHFYTLIIRNQALEEKYPGGLKGFLEKNTRALCNDDLSAEVAMSGDDLEDTVEDILQYRLKPKADWIVFDAADAAISLQMSRKHNWECPRINLGEWLDWRFDYEKGQFAVGYVEKAP